MERGKADPGARLSWQGRLKVELARLDARNRLAGAVSLLAIAILVLGAVSLFFRSSFWLQESIDIKIPPPILFVALVLLILLALYLVRRELQIRKLTLLVIEERQLAESERSAGMIDAVTHVFNRRFLPGLLRSEIARAERNHRPLTLVMCDLDRFKQINDRYGHVMGDEVLTETAAILKACVRGSDSVVRYGGDEFLLVLSETEEGGANAVVARIREKMAEWERSGELGISLSLGLYTHRAGQSAEQDIAEVDARLYGEKRSLRPAALEP
ncbi:MAG TPA: GGDEF domain-containing protein [Terriglobia bacterium]|jgi:diguanylate cyclase (GGDEF)-like protein|nr:GGDEF domain-containing protein [Terriglobia bacterium]